MFLEKNSNPGNIINLDDVVSMNWDLGYSVEFRMKNGQAIFWRYDTEEARSQDLDLVSAHLHDSGQLLSTELNT